tara:strand:- start:44 stop:265 length:222 start_codon:yes stop_codon:yes gene_type:complete
MPTPEPTTKILISSMSDYLEANIKKHVANVWVLLENPSGVADHPDIMTTIEGELQKISEYQDKLKALDNYFVG